MSQVKNPVSKNVGYVAAVFMVYATVLFLKIFVFPSSYGLSLSHGGGSLTWYSFWEFFLMILEYFEYHPEIVFNVILFSSFEYFMFGISVIAFIYIIFKKSRNTVNNIIPSHIVLIIGYLMLANSIFNVFSLLGRYLETEYRFIDWEVDMGLLYELIIGTLPLEIAALAVSIVQILLVNKRCFYENFRREINKGEQHVSSETI